MNTRRGDLYWRGAIAGLIAYAVIALVMALADLLAGRPLFHTPALLGSGLFYGLRDPASLVIAPGPVFAFNGVHLVVMLVIGIAAEWLAELSERGPHLWYVASLVFAFVLFHLFGFSILLNEHVRSDISPWTTLLAGALAVGGVVAYLLGVHPEIRHVFRDFDYEVKAPR